MYAERLEKIKACLAILAKYDFKQDDKFKDTRDINVVTDSFTFFFHDKIRLEYDHSYVELKDRYQLAIVFRISPFQRCSTLLDKTFLNNGENGY